MSRNGAASLSSESEAWACPRCGCQQGRTCRIEIVVARQNGERATLLSGECGRSALGLCRACDHRLLPELESLLDIWRQLGAIALACLSPVKTGIGAMKTKSEHRAASARPVRARRGSRLFPK
jgi:hypothetical protein